jgi:hypothetical protein
MPYDRLMQYEETYYGRRIVVTTTKNSGGRWTSHAEVVGEASDSTIPGEGADADFASEDEARRNALSRAAGAIDRARQRQGKP